jgi:hypothetical protein
MMEKLMKTNLVWHSDWNGEDLGYTDIEIIGLYSMETYEGETAKTVCFYIDIETDTVLESWIEDNEDSQQEEVYMEDLSSLQRVMERALLVESMIQSMEFHMHSLPEDMTQEEYEDFMQEYKNLNDELDALYDRSIELGYKA